ncbi:MAG: PadR family transcriptional regulator [Actinomycetota bacterium]
MQDVGLLVLSSLADEAKHGYAIQQDIEDFAGVRLGPGTLYGAIGRLEEDGLIRALRPADGRKPYEITRSGRNELDRKVKALRAIVRSAERRLRLA